MTRPAIRWDLVPDDVHYCDLHHQWHDREDCPDCDALDAAAWEADTDRPLVECGECRATCVPCDGMGVLPICASCAEQERREVIEHERRRLRDYARPYGVRS
jgi:hypothetical protein